MNLKYNLKFYGSLAIAIDQNPSLELDFTKQYSRLSTTFNPDIAKAAGADVAGFQAGLEEFKAAATAAHDGRGASRASLRGWLPR